MEKKLLQVGDVLYVEQYGAVLRTLTISRVTATRAYAKVNDRAEQCFHREFGTFGARPIPAEKWGPAYLPETPELQRKFVKRLLVLKASNLIEKVRPHDMNTEQLEKLIEALTPFVP